MQATVRVTVQYTVEIEADIEQNLIESLENVSGRTLSETMFTGDEGEVVNWVMDNADESDNESWACVIDSVDYEDEED